MDLETAIAAQVGTTPPEEITQLVLDACKATKVSGLEKFVNLRELTINGCGLTSLEGFPTLAKLEVLQLNDNQLTDGCLEALQDAGLLTLHTLSLAGNRFSTLESLEPLSACVNLRDLDLFNCAVTEKDSYREGVFDMIPGLKYLDGFDPDDNEKEDDEDEEDEGDEDLLSSEVGEDDDDLGEDDDEDGLGDLGDLDGEEGDDLGPFDDEEIDSEDVGEEGEEGEEGDEDDGEEDDGEEEGEGEDEDAPGAKRQRR